MTELNRDKIIEAIGYLCAAYDMVTGGDSIEFARLADYDDDGGNPVYKPSITPDVPFDDQGAFDRGWKQF